MNITINTQVVVLGAGPSGYSAAFRCADLGLDTIIVENYSVLGGVCLNVGCIPSKALLHIAKVIKENKILINNGIFSGEFKINIDTIRTWKEKIINKMIISLANIAKQRQVNIVHGLGAFISAHTIKVIGNNSITIINFDYAIIATGSRPIKMPCIPYEDPRVWDSTDALTLKVIPKKLLVIGAGIIGLEMSTVYHALGSHIDLVEVSDQIISPADKDMAQILYQRISKQFNIMLNTRITRVEAKQDGIYVTMEGKNAPNKTQCYSAILVAIGRIPNSQLIDAYKACIEVNENGCIYVDQQLRTNIPHIFAIGDIIGQPMLAHKGIHTGHIAAEVIAGMHHFFDSTIIPSISYTEPELAWVGITEKEAKRKDIIYKTTTFPWLAAGRAIISNCSDGMTKLIFNKKSNCIIGGAIVGTNGGELLGEIGLAIEMNCEAADIALTMHAHPTLYESIGLAAQVYEGSITDLPKCFRSTIN
ncbi:Dihydrolipoyl dehydrogenase [Candidatus Profftia lariciata]|uniref:dihydrolipoyl dehydrogenase n=1 Tax=Candidatus Profftia lariciata TaxID=1987921 RepID=UPI001D01CAC7|nr:dihydrolipoyl dehydrogenase [Candidatus Profftia lariciata]UDG81374.1 Dihydrolipoyl dehydrogenase [Candidatus Profftia lariciata]